MSSRVARTTVLLGITQTIAWASTYYLPAMVTTSMARDIGAESSVLFGAFSFALVVSALVGPAAGKAIDVFGGKRVLLTTNIMCAGGLVLLGAANDVLMVFLAWMLLGFGMGAGLYEAAFATVVRLYGHNARRSITGITLFAGFASTVGWPLTAYLEARYGWRVACFTWAGAHLLLALPLNALLPGGGLATAPQHDGAHAVAPAPPLLASGVLAFVFAAGWFTSTAMATHLPTLLMTGGTSMASAVAASALVGPAQVAARLLEFGFMRRIHPLVSARLASVAHPIGAGVLLAGGAASGGLFALLHGAGNGILTIAKGTLPLALFGPAGYGARQGLLMVPARVAQAAAPWAFGLCVAAWGAKALWLTSALGLASFFMLGLMRGTTGRAGIADDT
jgi:MFS family permease